MKTILFWIPRLFAIILALFLGILAIEVYGASLAWKKVAGLTIHLIPTISILILTVYTWKKPLWGSIAYALLLIFATFYFRTYKYAINFTLISLPLLVLTVLYVIDYLNCRRK